MERDSSLGTILGSVARLSTGMFVVGLIFFSKIRPRSQDTRRLSDQGGNEPYIGAC